MVLLQIANDSLNANVSIGTEHSFWFIIEVILILCVIIYQIYHSRNVYLNIEELKIIFNHRIYVKSGYIEKSNLNKKEKTIEDIVFIESDEETNTNNLFSDQNIVKISIAETSGSGIIDRIKENINDYLLNNYGAAVNFSIIKDIIEREVDIKDEEISHSIQTPLYLGLAATMIGIIFGLFAMPELNGDHFSKGIDALITGVKLAMFGSLTGLVCTTALSAFFYKNAKSELLEGENEQISYLVTKLLPELEKSGELGVSGLRNSLDKFSINTTGFAKVLHETTLKTESNLKIQQEIIQKIDRMDVLKVSKANIELFDRLDSNMDAFNKFSESLSIMSMISSNLKDFASRTVNIDKVVSQIDSSLQENLKLHKFLTSHFEKIETFSETTTLAVQMSGISFSKAIDLLDVNLKDSLDKLNSEIENRISSINKITDSTESVLISIFEEIGKKLNEITEHHIESLETAFSESIPQFNQLEKLELLPQMTEQLTENTTKIQNESNSNSLKIIDSISQLNSSILMVKELMNNQAVLLKLSSIDDNLSKKTGEVKLRGKTEKQVDITMPFIVPVKKEDVLSIRKVINGLFK
jgi:hypothetical protein